MRTSTGVWTGTYTPILAGYLTHSYVYNCKHTGDNVQDVLTKFSCIVQLGLYNTPPLFRDNLHAAI